MSSNLLSQVLDEAQAEQLFVHAGEGLSFRSAPDGNAEKLRDFGLWH